MRKFSTLIAVLAITLSLVMPNLNVNAGEKAFSDVPDSMGIAGHIYRFVDEGVINGYSDGTFGPWNEISREQAAIMLAKALDLEVLDSKEASKYFTDVKVNHANAGKIAAVAKANIMTGNNGKFNPYDKLTREQMATVLVRAFNLESTGKTVDINLSNVSDSHKDNVQQLANLGITNQLDNFRPGEYTSRSQFVTFLARSIDNSESLKQLLQIAYENEQHIETYEMDGSINLGMTLPDSEQAPPEAAMILGMLGDIQVDFTGSYQKSPMLMEATFDVTLQIDPQMKTTVSVPFIMSEDKMWMKPPQIPGAELPEEFSDKFIEIDMNELNEQPAIDLDAQMVLAQAIQNIFLNHFVEDYYDMAKDDSYKVPEGIDAKHIIKFSLNDEDVKPFVETLLTGFLPELFKMIQTEEYASSFGLTEAELEEGLIEFATMLENSDDMIAQLDNMIVINTFEEYTVINEQNIIANNAVNLDVDIQVAEDTFGLILTSEQNKRNIGQDVTINIPTADKTVTLEQLEEIMMEELELELK